MADAGNTLWNGDVGELGAALEGIVADAGHTLRNGDAGEAGTAMEGMVADGDDTAQNGVCFCKSTGCLN